MPSHKSLEARRAYHRAYMRNRYRTDAEFRRKQKARAAVGHALRDGKMEKQSCIDCGSEESQSHHEDYSKPLDVTWLCRSCHESRHGGAGCHGIAVPRINRI